MKLLNDKVPVPELRVKKEEVEEEIQDMILKGAIVCAKDDIYKPAVFEQEDETARQIALRLLEQPVTENISTVLDKVKNQLGISLSGKQEAAVREAFCHNLSIITGSPGTGKTTVLKTILEVYRILYPKNGIMLMAPTGRASRRMAESTGFQDAKTLHSGLGLFSGEEDAGQNTNAGGSLSADI